MIDGSFTGYTDRATVLCIDDDPQVTELIALRLARYHLDVLRASYGMQGLWIACTNAPDLIITDMRMPQGGGNYIIERLRYNAATHAVPVIVLTGQGDPCLEATARSFGILAFLTKPVRFDDLLAAIQKVIPLCDPDSEELEFGT